MTAPADDIEWRFSTQYLSLLEAKVDHKHYNRWERINFNTFYLNVKTLGGAVQPAVGLLSD